MRQVPENLDTVPVGFCNRPLGMDTVPPISVHPPPGLHLVPEKLDTMPQDLDTRPPASRSSRANFRAKPVRVSHFWELPGFLRQRLAVLSGRLSIRSGRLDTRWTLTGELSGVSRIFGEGVSKFCGTGHKPRR